MFGRKKTKVDKEQLQKDLEQKLEDGVKAAEERVEEKKENVKAVKQAAVKMKSAGMHSIILQMIAMMLGSILLTTIGSVALVSNRVSTEYESLIHDYLLDVAKAGDAAIAKDRMTLDTARAISNNRLMVSVGDLNIKSVESSYTYVVGSNGVMLYHPNQDKINTQVENEAIKDVLARKRAGETIEPDVVTYDYQGATKLAGYYPDEDGLYLIVVTADLEDALTPIRRSVAMGYAASIGFAAVLVLLAFAVIRRMFKPLRGLQGMITRMENLDFTVDEDQRQLLKEKNEFGIMAGALSSVQSKLRDTVEGIKDQSSRLFASSNGMYSNITNMTQTTEQVDHAVQEIAEGATTQANETARANENVVTIGIMIEDTNHEVDELKVTAENMKQAQNTALEILEELGKVNEQTRSSVDEIAAQTMTTNASATKIREVTGLITDIAEETNLLSLNASIEAARAGEAGKGFAVVASQIQKLADQSSNSAKQIEHIIDQLVADSQKAVDTMDEVKKIIDVQSEDVARTGEVFQNVSEGIQASIDGIEVISDRMKDMDQARVAVVDTVANLSAIAEENAASTQESSASMTSISNIADDMEVSSSDLKKIAEDLESNMSIFKL